MDEVFREENRIGIINWQKAYSPKSDTGGKKGGLSTATEYVLVYAKELEKAKTRLLDRTDEMDARYQTAADGDPHEWKSGDASGPNASRATARPHGPATAGCAGPILPEAPVACATVPPARASAHGGPARPHPSGPAIAPGALRVIRQRRCEAKDRSWMGRRKPPWLEKSKSSANGLGPDHAPSTSTAASTVRAIIIKIASGAIP